MDGLVLCLDGANYKSFKGEATTNLVSDPFALTGNPGSITWSGFEATNTRTGSLPSGDLYNISPKWIKIEKTSSSNGRVAVLGVSGLQTGVDYCCSFYIYSNDTNLTSLWWRTDNVAVSTVQSYTSYTSSDIGSVKRVQTIFRSVSGSQSQVLRINSTDPIGTTVYITGIQVEQKSYPTTVVNGTRGTTVATGGGWKDLIGSTDGTIVNGVRESSNNGGCLTLDGTNDYVSFSYPSINVNGPYTIIQWIRPSSALVAGGSGANKPTGANRKTSLVGPGPVWNPGIWMTSDYLRVHAKTQYRDAAINWTTTTWNMIGMTYDGTNTGIIYGGEFMSIAYTTAYSVSNPTTLYVGAENSTGNSTNWLGDVGMTMFYNKVLTAAEVKQNFDAHKGRYGL